MDWTNSGMSYGTNPLSIGSWNYILTLMILAHRHRVGPAAKFMVVKDLLSHRGIFACPVGVLLSLWSTEVGVVVSKSPSCRYFFR